MSLASNECVLILGSNKGKSIPLIEKCKFLIETHIGPIIKKSSLYKTDPWGESNQKCFFNQVLMISTTMTAVQLLKETQRIERFLGKRKTTKYGPRKIDIDILLFGQEIIQESDLIVPHPKMHERNFVLIPLAEIGKDIIHPIFGETIYSLQSKSNDICQVERFSN